MKFNKEKLSIGGETKTYFVMETGQSKELVFQIVASRQGIMFTGSSPHLETVADLEKFAKAVGDAWTEHLALTPKIVLNGSGH